MIDFGGITHVIQNPAGTFSLVGYVPRSLCIEREPTRADIMGGRVDPLTCKVYIPRVFKTAREAYAATESTATACRDEQCACAVLRNTQTK